MNNETAFTRIQRALEEFNAKVDKARADQAVSQEAIASVEYEVEQLKKLVAENALAH